MLRLCFRTRRSLCFPLPRPYSFFRKPHGTLQQSQNSPKSPTATTASNSPAPPISLSSPHFHHRHRFSLSKFYIRSLRHARLRSRCLLRYPLLLRLLTTNPPIPYTLESSTSSINPATPSRRSSTTRSKQASPSRFSGSRSVRYCPRPTTRFRSGFELRVAALLADISAANASRKSRDCQCLEAAPLSIGCLNRCRSPGTGVGPRPSRRERSRT
uniref:Uncharacterized protein n=1 Tax=Fagus sylvatica TaxID=28930 RepID=A0A2N9HWZ4_FAGSY